MRKPFSKKLHEDNDFMAKKAVLNWLLKQGRHFYENPDQYGIDLIETRGDEVLCGVEVECRHNWNREQFPYETIHVPERKLKFAELPFETYYCAVNEAATHCFWVNMTKLEDLKPMEIPNKFLSSMELFYDIPISMGLFYDLRE